MATQYRYHGTGRFSGPPNMDEEEVLRQAEAARKANPTQMAPGGPQPINETYQRGLRQPPSAPIQQPGQQRRQASIMDFGKETPMTRVAGMPMPKVDAAKIGFDPAVTRGLRGARMANEAAAAAEAEAARQAQLGQWGQRNQAEVGRIGQTGPVNYTRQEGATIDELMTRRGQRSGVAKAFDADIGGQEARILGLKGSLEALRTEYADAGKAGRAETDPFMQAIYSKQRELLTQKATDYQSRLSLAEELAQQSAASRGKAQADAAKAQEELLGIRRNEFGDGRLPNAPQDSALANSASEMSRSQQAKQQELLAEQQEIKGRAQRGNRELLPDEVTRLEAIDTEFKNNQANPDTMSPQRGNVRAEERAAKINDVVEPVKETVEDIKRKTGEAIDAGRAKVADGVQAAADAVKPNRPDNPNTPDVDESRTPGTDPDTTNREGIAQATEQERVKTSETPGSKEPGVVERIANRFRRGGQRFVNIAAGTAANDALNEMNQIEGAAKTKAKDDASLMRKVNRKTPEAASKFIADNPNISDNLKSILTERANGKQIRIAGAKEGLFKTVVNLPGDAVRATGRGVAAATKAARQGTKAMAKTGGKAGFVTTLFNIGNLYARNTSETDSALEGAKMTGGQLWDSAVNAFEKGKEIWNVSPIWEDAAAQYASAIGGDVAEGISQSEKGAKADARWWDQNVQQPFGPGYVNKPFYQIYDEEMAKGDTLGLDNVAKGLADNRAKHLAWMKDQALFDSPEGAEAPVQLAPSSPQRDWTANVVGPVTDVTDQYQAPPPSAPARGLAATRQPAAPTAAAATTPAANSGMTRADLGVTGQRQPFSSYGAGGQWMGLGGEAKAVPGLENYFGEGKPWTTADSDRLIATQLAERNTPEALLQDRIARSQIRFNNAVNSTRATMSDPNNWAEEPVRNEDGTISLERVAPDMLGVDQDALDQLGALDRSNVGAVQNQAGAASLRQGLQAARLANTMDNQAMDRANTLLTAALSTSKEPKDVDAKRGALSQLVAMGKDNPITQQVANTIIARAYQNQGPWDTKFSGGPGFWDQFMGRGPKVTPYSLGADAINQMYNSATWLAENGPTLPGMGVLAGKGDLSPEEWDFLQAFSAGNKPPGKTQKTAAASDSQAQAGLTPEEIAAMAQAQREWDEANRSRSGLRREQNDLWLQQMLYP